MGLVLVLFVAAVLVAGVGRMVYVDAMEHQAHVRQRLARRPRVSIAEAQEGIVRWTGRAHLLGEPLTAPASHRPCVAYQLTISLPRDEGGWKEVLELADSRPFVLADETGHGVVDPKAGPFAVSIVPDRKASTSPFQQDSEEVKRARALLRSENIDEQTFFGDNKPIRFSEAVLSAGAEVSVGGHCMRDIAPDGERAGYREPPKRLVLRGTTEEPLLISNWPDTFHEPD